MLFGLVYLFGLLTNWYYCRTDASHSAKAKLLTGLPSCLFLLLILLNPGFDSFTWNWSSIRCNVVSAESEKPSEEDGSNPQQYSFCQICSLWMQPDTVHCPLSNICVRNFKGYAAIIDRPIGKYTFAIALLFLALLALNSLYFLLSVISNLT